jgi:hypothetical protein
MQPLAAFLSVVCVLAFAAVAGPTQARDDSHPAFLIAQAVNPESEIPGQWSATTPQGTTVVHIVLNANPTKNADGSLSFAGKVWSTGTVQASEAPLEIAKLEGAKLTLKWSAGSGALTLNSAVLTGFLTYGNYVLKNMKFRKP